MKNEKKTSWKNLGMFPSQTLLPFKKINVKMGEKINVKIGGGGAV
jgi:hypothetical protein